MKIKFMPQNIEIEANPLKSLLQLAQENQIKIKSICNGKPSCSECRIKILEGQNNTMPPAQEELNLIGTSYFIDGRRLSCQVKCFGSMTIDLSEQMNKIDSHKKIKGVKTKDQKDIQAKQDTFILSGHEKKQEFKPTIKPTPQNNTKPEDVN